jgi:hypothetical protein
MKKNTIVQFVCFDTPLGVVDFLPQWENFADKFLGNRANAITLHLQEGNKNKFRYVSKNEWPSDDFQFIFQQARVSEKFSAGQVKVLQAGGYLPVQIENEKRIGKGLIKIFAFVNDTRTELNFYKELKGDDYLNIYEAYYENSLFSYVLEYYVKETAAPAILDQLKKQSLHTEAFLYRECLPQPA